MLKELSQDLLFDEWLSCAVKNKSEALAECFGIFAGLKNFSATRRLKTARRLKLKLWDLSGLEKNWSLKIFTSITQNKKTLVNFKLTHKNNLYHDFSEELIKYSNRLKNYWSWLRGFFGSAGNLYFLKSGYYLSLNASPEIFNVAAKFINKTNLNWSTRKNQFTLRNHENIVTFMSNINLSSAALKLEDKAVISELKNNANRLSNFEAANIKRSVQAAVKQVELARAVIENDLLKILPDDLKNLVMARLKYPDLNLSELGGKINEAKISKTAVQYRWTKIKKCLEQNQFNKSQTGGH